MANSKFAVIFIFFLSLNSAASAPLDSIDGTWLKLENSAELNLIEYKGQLTASRRSFYQNGSSVDWFFSFRLHPKQKFQPGEIIRGKVRSVDGFYNCIFEQDAQLVLESDGKLKLHYPLLTYTRRITEVGKDKFLYRQVWYWYGWEWVETIYSYPYRTWSVVNNECVIKQANFVTDVFVRAESKTSKN